MANLKFYKMAQAPVGTTEKPLEKGAIWFNSTNHSIEVYNGATWDVYTGVLDASYNDKTEKLVITNYNGSKVEIDFSIYATDEALGLLDKRVVTLEGTVAGHGESISGLSGRMTTVEGKAKANEDKLVGLSEATVMAEIAKQVKVADDRALEAEGKLAERVGTLETASEDHEDRIAVIEGKFEGDDSVAKQIENAVSAAEGRVQAKLDNKVENSVYNAYVEANDARVAAAEKAISDEETRALAAEAVLQEQIGSGFSKDATVAAAVKSAQDAAAEAQRTIDEFLTGEGIDPNKVENLKEIVKYIEDHGAEYSALVEDLGDLSDAIDVLNGNAETAGSVAKAVADAKTEINATIEANEKVTAEALSELDGRVDALEGMGLAGVIEGFEGRIAANEAAVATVDSRIATAKAGAEATAAADATSKANTAESNAKGYADGLIAAEETRSNKYADDAVAAEALIARAAEKANADAIAALDAKVVEGLAWVTFE